MSTEMEHAPTGVPAAVSRRKMEDEKTRSWLPSSEVQRNSWSMTGPPSSSTRRITLSAVTASKPRSTSWSGRPMSRLRNAPASCSAVVLSQTHRMSVSQMARATGAWSSSVRMTAARTGGTLSASANSDAQRNQWVAPSSRDSGTASRLARTTRPSRCRRSFTPDQCRWLRTAAARSCQ
jgi:hypothetical protein